MQTNVHVVLGLGSPLVITFGDITSCTDTEQGAACVTMEMD